MNDVVLGWTLGQVAEAVGGELTGDPDTVIGSVVTDSREDVAGHLFVALVGERFDGHAYVEDVLASGAAAVVVESGRHLDDGPRIEVPSCLDALSALARMRREEIDMPVVAITGSTGKTSTKDLLAAGIEGSWASPRSFNNEIGVPLTVLGTPSDATALILEVGSRGRGHIEWLAPVVQPDVAVITNLGVVHLETFGSEEDLAAAKFELVEALGPGGFAVLPGKESSLHREGTHRVITFGDSDADIRIQDIETDDQGCPSFRVMTPEGEYPVSLPLSGVHHAENTAAAVGVASALDLDLGDFCQRLGSAVGSAWRMEVHTGTYTVVNDAYNANPQSVASALKTVSSMGDRRIAVLGLMAELGPVCEMEHVRIGKMAHDLGFTELIVVGSDHGYASGFGEGTRKATDIEGAADTLAGIIEPGDVVLVKASRSAGLERLAHHLIKDSAS